MNREQCLTAAAKIVAGDREETYGTPERSFELIARLWDDYLLAKSGPLTPVDVAAMMALLKIARIAGGRAKEDNWVDLAGYAACGAELESGGEGR